MSKTVGKRQNPAFSQPGDKVNTFTASFTSDCLNCPGEIVEGETAGYLPGDSEPSCYECLEEFGAGED